MEYLTQYQKEQDMIRKVKIKLSVYLCKQVCSRKNICEHVKNRQRNKCGVYNYVLEQFRLHNYSLAYANSVIRNAYSFYISNYALFDYFKE